VGDSDHRIAVVDKGNQFLSYTHPARARKLLKQGRAEVFSTNPFIVKLKGERGAKMQPVTGPMVNFTKFFEEEKDIYVQNTAGGMQISITFEVAPGRTEHVTIPPNKKPFNLTQFVPFEAIKRSVDIRRLVTRRPPRIRLMTSEEYFEFFEQLARRRGTSPDEEIETSLQEHSYLMDKRTPPEEETGKPKSLDELREEIANDPKLAESEQIHPKVMGICAEVGPDVPDTEKPKARKIMDDLEALEDQLKEGDFEYLMSRGHYKSVRKWAKNQLDAVLSNSDLED